MKIRRGRFEGLTPYDTVFIGNYTKDTIISASGTRVVDGGGFNYGAHVGAMMGLRVAAVTRLAKEDFHVVKALKQMGVNVFATETKNSTCLRIVYPTSNVDEREIYVIHSAGSFTMDQFDNLKAKVILINASFRGEVGFEVVEGLSKRAELLAVDVQGFVRVNREGKMVYEDWPDMARVLRYVNVLKADIVESEMLTGLKEIRQAARELASYGPTEVVITHRDGVLVHAEGEDYEASFLPEALVGRSGRGDTCVAAYALKRLTASPAEATIWTAAVTSLKMEAEGPIRREVRDVENLIQTKYSSH